MANGRLWIEYTSRTYVRVRGDASLKQKLMTAL
jgi:hypothetical protein